MVDPTYYNPETDSAFDPEGFGAYWQNKLESDYKPFDSSFSDFEDKARTELDPLYGSVYDELSRMESQQKVDTAETYDDLLVNLQEGYNQRGTFFSGEAMTGETDLQKERGRAMEGITSNFGTQRSSLALDKLNQIQSRAETLQTNAYNDYLSTKTSTINSQVMDALKEFYPDYQKRLQEQMDDENSLWLDIPLEGSEETAPTTAPTPTPVDTRNGQPRNLAEEQKRLGNFGSLYGRQPQSSQDWNFIKIATYGYDGKRNIDSEKKAMQIFQDKYGRNPDFSNNVDKNIIHAIAYSGAKK